MNVNGFAEKCGGFKSNLFADAERNVLVLDHVGDLASHGEDKENDPVANQYRPEDGNIKD